MTTGEQKEKAIQFRRLHSGSPMLVLPNAWDAASARVLAQAGFSAIATTSSGVAAALGYGDGQQISRDMLIDATARITRVIECPLTADIEAGYGSTLEEVVQTARMIIETGAVGFNIEDSTIGGHSALVDISHQVDLIRALRDLAGEMDIPFVINARVDAFLLPEGEPEWRLQQAVQRGNAYLQAGADCVYPIAYLKSDVIASLASGINGPINILGGPPAPRLLELSQLGVARVSLAGGLMRSSLGHLRAVARELLEQGSYAGMASDALTGSEFQSLFSR
ncbi:MAG: isocitrate lyase/phosphoenolpyruvate mutase family protein [Chloroflexota bacterium]